MDIITIISIIIAVLCAIILFIFLVRNRRTNYKIVGTMHVDMTRDDKDICLLSLDVPLNDIADERYVLLRVDGKSNLMEWSK